MAGRGKRLHPSQVSEMWKPLYDQRQFPPAGTMCADCGCCRAGIYSGEDELRAAICIACDEGVLCGPKQKMHDDAVAQAQPTPAPDPEPSAGPALEPQEETPMETRLCKCGCGTELAATNKGTFSRGHRLRRNGSAAKPKAKRLPPPSTQLAKVEPVIEVDAPEAEEPMVAINLTTGQLARIFFALPIEEQGLAIQSALSAERE